MLPLGLGSRLVAATSAQSLRVVGAVTVLLSTGVASLSVTTNHGLAVTAGTADQSATLAADVGLLPALVEFAMAAPAYPVATALGLFLLVVGDNAPLIGG